MSEKKNLSGFAKVMIAASVAGALCIPCTGILAAVAIPSFITFTRRSKTVEARANLGAIRMGITARAMEVDRSQRLPASLPATPPAEYVSALKQAWPSDADPGWGAIGFQPSEPLYYAYSVTSDPSTNTVTIEAVGDLDDDGTHSSFSQTGRLNALGDIEWSEVVVTNELE